MKSYFKNHIQVILFCCAIVVYFITAYNSDGYYHADEHYQIIEYASMKMHKTPVENLAWEYHRQIRSTIQPTLAYFIFFLLEKIHITDAYQQVFVLRLLSMFLALLSILFFTKVFKKHLDINYQNVFVLLSYFLWFLPMLNVRFSSETWAGLIFLIVLAIVNIETTISYKRAVVIGILIGLSFLFRYQMAFAIIGLLLWLIFIHKTAWKYLFTILLSSTCIFILGVLIDSWFYGIWVLSSWNYFQANIIEHIASNFGTKAWYYYLIYIFKFPSYPIGLIILLATIFLIYEQPKHLLIWCIVPFIVGHSIIAHKEERFLFPMINLVPFLIVLAYQEFIHGRKIRITPFKIFVFYTITICILLINFIGLSAMAFKAAGVGRMAISKYIHIHYKNEPLKLYITPYASAINPWQGLPATFYQDKNVEEIPISSLCDLTDSLRNNKNKCLVLVRKDAFYNSQCEYTLRFLNYHKVKQSIPRWVEVINIIYGGFSNDIVLQLYEKKE